MTFLCCFRSSVRPVDSWDHLSPEDAEEAERQERIARCHTCTRLNDDRLIVQGVLQRAEARNRNGRVYPKATLKRETDRFLISHVRTGKAFGELDHPDFVSEATFKIVDGQNVSHQVLDYWWDGDDLVGVVEVLPTAKGDVLKAYFLAGKKIGVSSRSWSSLLDIGDGRGIVIQDDFELITFDFVADPSTEGAFLLPLMDRYQKLQDMPDLSGFETFRSHPLEELDPLSPKHQGALRPPPKAANKSRGNGRSSKGDANRGRSSGGAKGPNGGENSSIGGVPPRARDPKANALAPAMASF